MNRRSLLCSRCSAPWASSPSARPPGREFPEREVTIIVPTSAGGGTDIFFRALARATEPHLGKPIVVVNRPGAGGAIGHAEIARAKPDGYTLGAILQQMFMAWSRPELTYKHEASRASSW